MCFRSMNPLRLANLSLANPLGCRCYQTIFIEQAIGYQPKQRAGETQLRNTAEPFAIAIDSC